jgi:starvation-inducible outer membrane lipoprotein
MFTACEEGEGVEVEYRFADVEVAEEVEYHFAEVEVREWKKWEMEDRVGCWKQSPQYQPRFSRSFRLQIRVPVVNFV